MFAGAPGISDGRRPDSFRSASWRPGSPERRARGMHPRGVATRKILVMMRHFVVWPAPALQTALGPQRHISLLLLLRFHHNATDLIVANLACSNNNNNNSLSSQTLERAGRGGASQTTIVFSAGHCGGLRGGGRRGGRWTRTGLVFPCVCVRLCLHRRRLWPLAAPSVCM